MLIFLLGQSFAQASLVFFTRRGLAYDELNVVQERDLKHNFGSGYRIHELTNIFFKNHMDINIKQKKLTFEKNLIFLLNNKNNGNKNTIIKIVFSDLKKKLFFDLISKQNIKKNNSING